MTRRGVFMVAGQALGGVAAVGVLLPVVGFAVAPILETPEETWVGVGAPDDFVVDSYRAVTLTIRSGIGEAGKTTAYVRKGSEDLNEDPPRSSRSRPGVRTSAAPSGSSTCRHLQLPLPRWRLRLRGPGDRRPASVPARPVPDPGRGRRGPDRAPLQRHQRARARPRP